MMSQPSPTFRNVTVSKEESQNEHLLNRKLVLPFPCVLGLCKVVLKGSVNQRL